MSKHLIQDRTATVYADQARRIASNENTFTIAEVAELLSKVQGKVIEPENGYLIQAINEGEAFVLKSGKYDTGMVFALPEPPKKRVLGNANLIDNNYTFEKWLAPVPTSGNLIIAENFPITATSSYSSKTGDVEIIVYVSEENLTVRFHYTNYDWSEFGLIDWGDGSTTNINDVDVSLGYYIEHTYTSDGNYVIKMFGRTQITCLDYDASTVSVITHVTIPQGVPIKYGLFVNGDPTNLLSVTICCGVETLGTIRQFQNSKLSEIYIPNTIQNIPEDLCYNVSTLKKVILDYGIKDIGRTAFYNCTGLTEITIPATVTNIDYSAFRGCTSLTSIAILDGVTSIGEYAFADCYSLTKITIPESVENIGEYAFQYMGGSNTSLERHSITVVYNAHCEMPQTMFHGTIIKTLIITYADGIVPLLAFLTASQVGDVYVPDTLVDSYKAAESWSTYANRIKPLSECEEDY